MVVKATVYASFPRLRRKRYEPPFRVFDLVQVKMVVVLGPQPDSGLIHQVLDEAYTLQSFDSYGSRPLAQK